MNSGDLELPDQPPGEFVPIAGAGYHVTELGSGSATLFLHGGGPGSSAWTDFGAVAPLFAADRSCYLVDLLQYGQSAKPAVEGPMWSFHAAKLKLLLDALDLAQADLVCNSWGGSMGLCLAARHPDRVRSVTVTGCVPVQSPPGLVEGVTRGRAARNDYYGGSGPSVEKMRDLMAQLEWFDSSRIPATTIDLRYRQSLDREEIAVAGHSDSARGMPEDLSERLPDIECPALFFWGMHDPFVPPEYALMLARSVALGQLHVLDRTSHHPQEERPREYHRIVSAFLNGASRA
jgi:pimeloyl-ACP methyl ester carboxylesterase